MSTYKVHCQECRDKLGKDWAVVHRWLDYYASSTFPTDIHRIHRHHTAGVEEVRQKWGDEAAEAAKLHILDDVAVYGCDHVPGVDEITLIIQRESIDYPKDQSEF